MSSRFAGTIVIMQAETIPVFGAHDQPPPLQAHAEYQRIIHFLHLLLEHAAIAGSFSNYTVRLSDALSIGKHMLVPLPLTCRCAGP